MSPWRILYSLSLYALMPLALMRCGGAVRKQPAYRRHIAERFGYYSIRPQQPILWIHSVSVGETRAAEPLVEALRERWPDHAILFTHMTPTGGRPANRCSATASRAVICRTICQEPYRDFSRISSRVWRVAGNRNLAESDPRLQSPILAVVPRERAHVRALRARLRALRIFSAETLAGSPGLRRRRAQTRTG
jgi:hypothetical protein